MMADITKKSLAEQHAARCIHFRGIQHETCEAGVDWRALTGGENFGIAKRMPCMRGNESTITCPSCHFPTPEEVQAHVLKMEAHMQRRREDGELIGANHAVGAASIVYVCELCDRAARHVTRTPIEISAHLQETHGVEADAIQMARQQPVAHLDAREWFQTDDRFTLPDGRVFLTRSTRQPRAGTTKRSRP